jgi:hypothetical protein
MQRPPHALLDTLSSQENLTPSMRVVLQHTPHPPRLAPHAPTKNGEALIASTLSDYTLCLTQPNQQHTLLYPLTQQKKQASRAHAKGSTCVRMAPAESCGTQPNTCTALGMHCQPLCRPHLVAYTSLPKQSLPHPANAYD